MLSCTCRRIVHMGQIPLCVSLVKNCLSKFLWMHPHVYCNVYYTPIECNRNWNVTLRLIAIGCWVDWLFKPFVPSLVQHGRIYPQHHQPPPQLSTFSSELNQKLIAAFQTFWAVISWNPPKDHLPHSVPAPAAHQHDNFPQSIQWPTFSSSCCNQRQIQKTHTFHTITMNPSTIHAHFSNHFLDIFIQNQTTTNPAS